jgi:hypothetical protein
VCPQKRVPGLQPAPARQLMSHEPVEKTSDVGFHGCLHAQQLVSRPVATNVLRNNPVAVVGASTGAFGAVWAQAEPVKSWPRSAPGYSMSSSPSRMPIPASTKAASPTTKSGQALPKLWEGLAAEIRLREGAQAVA